MDVRQCQHPQPQPLHSKSSSLARLPVELIDMMLGCVDTSTLFRLCHVDRHMRALAQPRLFQHALQVTMRLWIGQAHGGSQKPIDFVWSHCDGKHNRMVFVPQQEDTAVAVQPGLPPAQIDGCTVLIKVGNSQSASKRIYSISYKDRVVPLPVEQRSAAFEPRRTIDNDDDLPYTCGWTLRYSLSKNNAHQRLVPCAFECDMDLLDPQVLSASSPLPSDKVVGGPEHAVPSSHHPIQETKKQHHHHHHSSIHSDPFSRILPDAFVLHA